MAKLKDKIQNALEEGRILVLGSQVLLGFQYRSTFEPGFENLPHHAQYMKLAGLILMIIAIGMLMLPGAYHRIVEEGEDTEELHRFTTGVMGFALLPFAIGLGLDMFIAGEKVMSRAAGVALGLVAGLAALFFWYGLEAIRKSRRTPAIEEEKAMERRKQGSESGGAKVKDKIKHVLTEARMVLPGAQALLGFQLATMLMEAFDRLPESSRYVHLVSLLMVGLSTVLLMTPAAYHRIVEQGEQTEHFHRFSSRILIAAMVPLALGIAGDMFVVVRKVTESTTFALAASAAMLALFYGFWFGFTAYRRARRGQSQRVVKGQEPQQA
jgi:hypothetical protein